jgi:hypothetical protein
MRVIGLWPLKDKWLDRDVRKTAKAPQRPPQGWEAASRRCGSCLAKKIAGTAAPKISLRSGDFFALYFILGRGDGTIHIGNALLFMTLWALPLFVARVGAIAASKLLRLLRDTFRMQATTGHVGFWGEAELFCSI